MTRCSLVRILSSFFTVLVASVSVTVLINYSDTADTQGIARTDHDLLQKKDHPQFIFNAAAHHVSNIKSTSLQGQHHMWINKYQNHTNNTGTRARLSSQDIKGLKTFVFFIGYPRSGHSIIGSMLDAHPNAIIAHEFNLFAELVSNPNYQIYLKSKYHLLNTLYRNSYKQSVIGWRSNNTRFSQKGYTLELNSTESWQGRFTSLRVIGDKSGAATARSYRGDPQKFKEVYNSMANILKIPMRAIHVVRNPFDMIATRLLYHYSETRGRKGNFNETHQLNGSYVYHPVERIYTEAQAIHEMIRDCNLTVFEIHHADFVHDPKEWMTKLCDFLGLECSQSYLEMCDENTFKTLSKTRYNVEWQDETRQSVDSMIKEFSFFQRYSYDSD